MKTLLTLFAIILSVGVANAQTKKPVVKKTDTPAKTETTTTTKGPTKEETIEYIKNELQREFNLSIYTTRTDYKVYLEDLDVQGCDLVFIKRTENSGEISKEKIIIPLDKIESIEEDYSKYTNGAISSRMIIFLTYQKQKLISQSDKRVYDYQLPLSYADLDMNVDARASRNIEKLTKAFNHLRKLCGAPEPISFD
jgi:hypothetical protein